MTKEERALAAARTLRDFCGEWDCTVCPFLIEDSLLAEDFQCRLSVQSPAYWKIEKVGYAGRRKPKYTITVDSFGELVPDPKLSSEREYQLLQIPLGDGRFELVSTSLVEIEYY